MTKPKMLRVALAVRRRVVAFEAPQQETRALQSARRAVSNALQTAEHIDNAVPRSWARGSISIRDQRAYELVLFLLSEDGARKHPHDHAVLVQAIMNRLASSRDAIASEKQCDAANGSPSLLTTAEQATWLFSQDAECSYTIATAAVSPVKNNTSQGLLVLFTYRPNPVMPLCWTSARRAVRFVNAVVSLVTANAFISTLGGGHFLCKHLDQAKLMAKIQIAVSVGLQDPVLESKCRVNLAYGAMQGGRFRRAYRIIERELVVAQQLENDELEKICNAAKVYLIKTYRLHKEYLRNVAELGKNDRLFDNFYRQRIVRAANSVSNCKREPKMAFSAWRKPRRVCINQYFHVKCRAANALVGIASSPWRRRAAAAAGFVQIQRSLSIVASLTRFVFLFSFGRLDGSHRIKERVTAIVAGTGKPSALQAPSPELEQDCEKKASSSWVSRYQEQAKCELVNIDIAPLMDRFESVSLYHKPQRKPLNVALQEMSTLDTSRHSGSSGSNQPKLSPHPSVGQLPGQHPELHKQNTLKRQATKVIHKRRVTDQHAADNKSSTDVTGSATSNARARIVPTRFLYDTTRWKQSARCDYCSFAGGDLECATCDVIAHARCYLSAYKSTQRKTKGAFVVPTRFSWLCDHCQQSLQQEYDERSKQARMQHIALQRHIFGKVVTAYVRMTKDAMIFQAKKRAIVKIQATFRGRLARLRFDHIQRMCLKPYAVDGIKVRGFSGDGGSTGTGASSGSSAEDLRLANGFTCNPYMYVSVVDGKDDESQLFCFETSLRKGVSLSEATTDVCWGDRLFVPGVDGNVTLCFTLLSKNGPNNFFLGQAVLRLRDSDVIWRSGVTAELLLSDEVEIFPKTTQHQLLRLVEVGGGGHDNRQPKRGARDQQHQASGLFANTNSNSGLTLSVHVKPFSDVHSYCGYMGMKNTLDSFQTSSRWCVLADGVLRIYRHFGVTLASDVVDMARALEVKLVEASRATNSNGVFHHEHNCLAIQHVSRLYLLQCDNKAANKLWLKKLQAAIKFGSAVGAVGDQSSCSLNAVPLINHSSTSQ